MVFAESAFAESAFAAEGGGDNEFRILSAEAVTRYGSLVADVPQHGTLTGHVVTQYGALSATNEFVPLDLSGRISPLQTTRYGSITGKVDPIIQSAGVVTKYGSLAAAFGFVGRIEGVQGTQYGALTAEMSNAFPVQSAGVVTKYGALYGAFDQRGLMQGSVGTRYGRIAGPDRLPQGGEFIAVQKRQQQLVAFVRL
jgi:hypothetical protein